MLVFGRPAKVGASSGVSVIYRRTYCIRGAEGNYGTEVALPTELEMQEAMKAGDTVTRSKKPQ